MEIRDITEEIDFKPITLSLRFTSLEELAYVAALFNESAGAIRNSPAADPYPEIKNLDRLNCQCAPIWRFLHHIYIARKQEEKY